MYNSRQFSFLPVVRPPYLHPGSVGSFTLLNADRRSGTDSHNTGPPRQEHASAPHATYEIRTPLSTKNSLGPHIILTLTNSKRDSINKKRILSFTQPLMHSAATTNRFTWAHKWSGDGTRIKDLNNIWAGCSQRKTAFFANCLPNQLCSGLCECRPAHRVSSQLTHDSKAWSVYFLFFTKLHIAGVATVLR